MPGSSRRHLRLARVLWQFQRRTTCAIHTCHNNRPPGKLPPQRRVMWQWDLWRGRWPQVFRNWQALRCTRELLKPWLWRPPQGGPDTLCAARSVVGLRPTLVGALLLWTLGADSASQKCASCLSTKNPRQLIECLLSEGLPATVRLSSPCSVLMI